VGKCESIRKKDLSGVSTELRHINHCSIPDSALQVPPLLNDLKHECVFEWVCVCDREWTRKIPLKEKNLHFNESGRVNSPCRQ